MSDNAALMVDLTARLTKFEAEMKKAKVITDRQADAIEDRFRKINPGLDFVKGLGTGALAGLSVDRLVSSLKAANDEIAKLGQGAMRAGLDVERLQELQFAGRQEGLDPAKFAEGLSKLAQKLNDARREESELGKLFAENNIQIKDRNGNILDTETALRRVADLVQRAGTYWDAVKVAETAGLTADWVRFLRQGGDEIARQAAEARNLGAVISSDVVRQAEQFQRDWDNAWSTFKTVGFATIAEVAAKLGMLAQAARDFRDYINTLFPNTITDAQVRQLQGYGVQEVPVPGTGLPEITIRGSGQGSAEKPAQTRIPTSSRGGGSSGQSDADKAQARLERYIETLMRQEAVEKAIAETVGQSRAAQQAAVEIARAGVDLAKLDEESRKRITDQLTAQVTKLEQQREITARLRQQQAGYQELLRLSGNTAIDALDRMIAGGASFGEVVGDITRQLSRMVLQAALLGQGPLAALFGTQASGGGIGGLFGALFGGARAAGGPVTAGRAYLVGEKGPELFQPGTSGRIIPNDALRPPVIPAALSRGGGAAQPVSVVLTQNIDARGSQMSEAQFRSILAENNKVVLSQVPAAVQKARGTRDLDTRR